MIEAIIGAFSNSVIRGDAFEAYKGQKWHSFFTRIGFFDKGDGGFIASKWVNAGIFAVVHGFVYQSLVLAFFAFVTMMIGQSFGWGMYVGAVGGRNGAGDEVPFIDRILMRFKNRPLLWGMFGLTIRGCLWALLLSLSLPMGNFVLVMIAGLSMGLCFYTADKVSRLFNGKINYWALGEAMFGFVLWGACFL